MLGTVLANHVVLSGAGLWPRSQLLGANWTSLPRAAAARDAVALTIDDGPDPEVTPRVLDLLDAHAAKASFFCIGERVARYPALVREAVRRGHAIENHSQRHLSYFSLLGPGAMAQEVERAQLQIGEVTGQLPRFFRAPAGLRNPFLDPVLAQRGLQLVSWTRRGFDTLNRKTAAVLRALTHKLGGGDILLLHDGHAGRTPTGSLLILEVLPPLLAALSSVGLSAITLRSALWEREGGEGQQHPRERDDRERQRHPRERDDRERQQHPRERDDRERQQHPPERDGHA
jgi:peptidoglycan-N-acetylglucosamine deacetylase